MRFTDKGLKRGDGRFGKSKLSEAEDGIGRAVDFGEGVRRQVLHRADHVVEAHEESRPLEFWVGSAQIKVR